MDEGKDSLGTTRAQNADGFDASAQSSAQSVDSTTSSDSPADNKIISSANLAPPTPLNAPLPTDPLHPIQTVGTGSGDVMVGERRAKNKKPLIIGAIILAVVAIIGIIVVSINSSSKNEVQGDTSVESFNRYANYLLFDEEKPEAPSGEFDLDTTYEVDRQLSRENMDEPYWGTAKNLLSNAIDSYSNTENPTNPTMGSVLSDYQKTFDFIYLYRQAGDFDETDIIDLYNGSGPSAATTEITNFYKQFSDLDSQTSKNYARQRVAQYDAMIRLYGIYDSLGCIQEGEINESICSGIPDEGMSE